MLILNIHARTHKHAQKNKFLQNNNKIDQPFNELIHNVHFLKFYRSFS